MLIASSGTLLLRAGPRFSRPTASPAPPLQPTQPPHQPCAWHWSPPSGAPLEPTPASDAPLEPFWHRRRALTKPHASSTALPEPHTHGFCSPTAHGSSGLARRCDHLPHLMRRWNLSGGVKGFQRNLTRVPRRYRPLTCVALTRLSSAHVRGSHSPIVRSCAWLSLAPRAACCLRRHPPRRARRRRSRTYCCFAHGRCSRLKRRQDRIAHLMLRWNLSGATEGP